MVAGRTANDVLRLLPSSEFLRPKAAPRARAATLVKPRVGPLTYPSKTSRPALTPLLFGERPEPGRRQIPDSSPPVEVFMVK